MRIIIEDSASGKQVMAKGCGNEFMVYRKNEGIMVNGKLMTRNGKELKNEWTFTGLYPSTIQSAVFHCMNIILLDEDNDEEYHVEAEKARVEIAKILKKRLDEITAHVMEED